MDVSLRIDYQGVSRTIRALKSASLPWHSDNNDEVLEFPEDVDDILDDDYGPDNSDIEDDDE